MTVAAGSSRRALIMADRIAIGGRVGREAVEVMLHVLVDDLVLA